MPEIKLTYFPMAGRAAVPRMAFAIADIKFEDVRLDFEQWGKVSGDAKQFPNGALPALSVDGKSINQSLAISDYACNLANLIPADPVARAAMYEYWATLEELFTGTYGVNLMATFDKEGDEQKKSRLAYVSHFHNYFKRVEQMIGENGKSGFAIGNNLTGADLAIYTLISSHSSGFFDHIDASLFENYPNARKVHETVGSIPAVQDLAKTGGC